MAAMSDSNTSASNDGGTLGFARHPFADDEELLQAEGLADLGAGLAAHHDGLDLGQIAFEVFRIALRRAVR